MYYFLHDEWPTLLSPFANCEEDRDVLSSIDLTFKLVPLRFLCSANCAFAFYEWAYGTIGITDVQRSPSFKGWILSSDGDKLSTHCKWEQYGLLVSKLVWLPADAFHISPIKGRPGYDIDGMSFVAFGDAFDLNKKNE